MPKILLSFVIAIISLLAPFDMADAAVKPGASCVKQNSQKLQGGKVFTCIKKSNGLIWDNGKVTSKSKSSDTNPAPKPSSTPSPINEMAGLTWMNKGNGQLNLSLVMRSIKGNFGFIADGVNFNTSYSRGSTILDIWDNKIIACPSFCNNAFYKSEIKGGTLQKVSLDQIKHPDYYTFSWFKGANFGQDSRYAFALTNFGAIDGLFSVVYRIDTVSGERTPIFTTYCVVSGQKSCGSGMGVTGLRADHHNSNLYLGVGFISRSGTNSLDYENTFILKLDQMSPAVSMRNKAQAAALNSFYEYAPNAKAAWIAGPTRNGESFNNLTPSLSGNDLYYTKTEGDMGQEINQICKISLSSLASNCFAITPFTYISDLVVLEDDLVLYDSANFNTDALAMKIFDFKKQAEIPVNRPNSSIESFNIIG